MTTVTGWPSAASTTPHASTSHALAHTGDHAEVTVLDGNPHALALYRSEGFVVRETRTGPLVGNERFTATGHLMRRPAPGG
jgi:hypothetical protein